MYIVACDLKLGSVIRSSMHASQGNWVAIGHTVGTPTHLVQELNVGTVSAMRSFSPVYM